MSYHMWPEFCNKVLFCSVLFPIFSTLWCHIRLFSSQSYKAYTILPFFAIGHVQIWAAARQNQQNDLYAQRRLWSAWPYTQDQSMLSAWRSTGPRLIGVFPGCIGHFVDFVMLRLIYSLTLLSCTPNKNSPRPNKTQKQVVSKVGKKHFYVCIESKLHIFKLLFSYFNCYFNCTSELQKKNK